MAEFFEKFEAIMKELWAYFTKVFEYFGYVAPEAPEAHDAE